MHPGVAQHCPSRLKTCCRIRGELGLSRSAIGTSGIFSAQDPSRVFLTPFAGPQGRPYSLFKGLTRAPRGARGAFFTAQLLSIFALSPLFPGLKPGPRGTSAAVQLWSIFV